MNPCHPLCFFLYFLHEENICFVAVQEQLPDYLLPLALTSTTIVVKQHTVVCIPQHHQTCTCVSTLSPTSPTPMHTQCTQTAYFHSNSNTYITPTLCFLFSVDPLSFTSHSGPDTPVSLSTRVKTKSLIAKLMIMGAVVNYHCLGQCQYQTPLPKGEEESGRVAYRKLLWAIDCIRVP